MTAVDYFFCVLPSVAAAVSILWIGFQWYHSAPMTAWRSRRKPRSIAASVKRGVVWCNAMLLAVFSFTGDIAEALNTYLPGLAPYLPPDVHRWIGLALVVLNIVHAIWRGRARKRQVDQQRNN